MEVGREILQPPVIRTYSCYRRFMLDFFAYKKSHRSGFSHRKFAQLAGVKSPNYLQLVMKGERNLSVDLAYQVAKAMGLGEAETDYFVSLVRQDGAKSQEELRFAEKESLRAIKRLTAKDIKDEGFRVLEKWYHLAVRELAFLPDFKPQADYVHQRMRGLISMEEAEESLELLMRLKVLVHKDGRWQASDPVIDTGNDYMLRELALNFHKQNLDTWSRNLDRVPYSQIETGLLNISLPQSKIPKLREKLREFQDELIGWLESEQSADSTVQVGVYMFPVAMDDKKK